jgi:hypothetical protein
MAEVLRSPSRAAPVPPCHSEPAARFEELQFPLGEDPDRARPEALARVAVGR